MARPAKPKKENNGGANLGFEVQLFQAADKMRGSMDASEYKHVALGLIFLKYISDAFEAKHAAIKADGEDPEDRDFYIADNVFWLATAQASLRINHEAVGEHIGGHRLYIIRNDKRPVTNGS